MWRTERRSAVAGQQQEERDPAPTSELRCADLARGSTQRIAGRLDHARRRVDPGVAAAPGLEQPPADGGVAAAEIEDPEPPHVAERVMEGRLFMTEFALDSPGWTEAR
jgi:hypothetical protein